MYLHGIILSESNLNFYNKKNTLINKSIHTLEEKIIILLDEVAYLRFISSLIRPKN